MTKCRFCAEEINPDAVVCKHCGRSLTGEKSPGDQFVGLGKLLIVAVGILIVVMVLVSVRSGFD